MRETTVDFLGKEASRLRAVLPQKPLYHPSGVRLHSNHDPITPELARLMKDLGMGRLCILEPGESELKAFGALEAERVEPRALAEGDVLAEDLPGSRGSILLPAGQVLDAASLPKAKGSGAGSVAIRRRGAEDARKQALDYLAARPPAPAQGPRADMRFTEALRGPLIQSRPLLVPLGRIAVAVRDDFLRAVIVNTLAGAGHEAAPLDASAAALDKLKSGRPNLLVTDLEGAKGLCAAIRKVDVLWNMGILVCAEEGRKAEVLKAIEEGANDSISRPPPPDALLLKAAACMQAFGRSVNFKPAVLLDRRRGPRHPLQAACEIRDAFLSKPLPVPTATAMDFHDAGMRIEYGRPDAPCPHAFLPHGVHPRHFFYGYAKSNPLGRDLTLKVPLPGAGVQDRFAKVVHITLAGAYEVAGLAFQRGTATTRETGPAGGPR